MKNELEPWLSADEFAELQAAAQLYREDGPGSAQLSRMLTTIQSGGAPAAGAAGAVKLKLAALMLGALGVVSALVWASIPKRDEAVAVPSSSAPVAQVAAPLLPRVDAQSESAPQSVQKVAATPVRKKPSRSAVSRSHESRAVTPQLEKQSDPAAELALLSRARRVLHSAPSRALVLTEQHLRDYPRGAFCEERELLAIEALLNAGQARATLERAQRFVQTFGSSVHLSQVNTLRAQAQQRLLDDGTAPRSEDREAHEP